MKEKGLYRFIKYPVYFFGGILFSFPYTGGAFSPFTASFTASGRGLCSVLGAAGSILGVFIFHSGLTCFRYFAITLMTSATLNIALRAFRLKNEAVIRILCPAVCCFTVNFIFLLSQKSSFDLFLSVLCETVLCAAVVPVFCEAEKQLCDGAVFSEICEKDKSFICFILSVALAAAHLRCAGIIGEALCCFLFFFLIMSFSQIKGFEGGVVTGICCSFVFAMNGDADFACVMFALSGCLCSFFEIRKRFIKAVIISVCALMGSAFGEYTAFLPIVPSAAAAGVVFCLIPQRFLKNTDKNRQEEINISTLNTVRSNEIAYAVKGLSDCVSAVRKTLEPLVAPSLKNELIKAGQKVCTECDIYDSCINEIKKSDNPCYEKLSEKFSSGDYDFSCMPENFGSTCYHSSKMMSEMKKAYFVHCTNVSADSRINRIQTAAGNQFRTFGGIIGQACEAAAGKAVLSSRFDSVCAASAEEFGIEIKDARLCTDKAGREYFDLSFYKTKNNFSVTDLTEKLKIDTGYRLDFPTLVQNGDVYSLIFKQKEKLTFNISAAVRPADGKNVCGDYYRCFKDSFSRQTILLSDGMGTGSRAAVDSAFTCETFCNLIKSGLDEKTAAAAVNSAMMMKSTDESFSTIDFLRLDPILKTAELFKCGAGPSFILKNKKASVVETESTPIGILDSVNMSVNRFSVEPGDIIILASDGVSSDRFNWLCGELKSWNAKSSSALARHILQCAADRKIGKRADDMTVIAVCVADKE